MGTCQGVDGYLKNCVSEVHYCLVNVSHAGIGGFCYLLGLRRSRRVRYSSEILYGVGHSSRT